MNVRLDLVSETGHRDGIAHPAATADVVFRRDRMLVAEPATGLPAVKGRLYDPLKRSMDIVLSLAALVFLSPLFLIIALALIVQDGFPIVYSHRRVGKDGKSFGCLKFRSMVRDSKEQLQNLLDTCPESRKEWEETQKLRNDPRIHRLGAFLRRSSLDELPQIVNVLTGSMSIVGPRPIVTEEMKRYGGKFATYASVRPGLTGLWQVSGRSDVGYEQRVAYDVDYVARRSLLLDVTIIVKTALVVLSGRGSC